MTDRKWFLVGLLTGWASLCVLTPTRAAEPDPATKKSDKPAAADNRRRPFRALTTDQVRPGGLPTAAGSDPEMHRLFEADAGFERQSQELAEEYRRAPKDKQDEVKKKLEDVVSRQFESRQERRSLELKRLEGEIKRIQASIDKRNEAKKQIVDRRVSEVLGQDDTSF